MSFPAGRRPRTGSHMNHPMTVSVSKDRLGPSEATVSPQQARYMAQKAEEHRLSDAQIARLGGPRVWEAMNAYADRTWSPEKREAWDHIARYGSPQDQQRALADLKREFHDNVLRREPTGQGNPA